MTNEEIATLKGEYEALRDEALAALPPYARPMHHIAWPSFARWLADRGYEAPEPDLTDPYTATRFAQYLAFRERELAPIAPEARASVEPHFIAFEDWLSGEEAHERYFGSRSGDE